MDRNQIWKIYGTDFTAMTKRLLEATDLAGHIGDRQKCVGIKPNLVTSSPADYGATTHPEIIAGIIEYLHEHGFRNLLIAEGSWVGDKTREAFEYCGYNELSRAYGVPLVDGQKEKYHKIRCAGMDLLVTDVVDRIDFLINVPVMKGHCQTKMTCALKNLKGLLPNKEKSHFHAMGLHKPIAHLQAGIHQDFIVVDHICGDLDFEEGGNPVVCNTIMAALDPVLLDSYVLKLMNYTPDDVPYVRMAEALGIGTCDLDTAEIVNINEGEETELKAGRRVLEVSYAVDEVDSCSACYGMLIGALCRLKEEGLLEKLDTKIGIGQGMRGKTGRLGIGRCTKDFDFCVMGCPPDEEKIYRELKAYIEGHS